MTHVSGTDENVVVRSAKRRFVHGANHDYILHGPLLTAGLLLLTLARGVAIDAAAVSLTDLVPDYMDGDLETAVTPTPQRARLGETAFAAGNVVVVKPDAYKAPNTLFEEIERLFGEQLAAVTDAKDFSPQGADTVVFVGRLPKLRGWQTIVRRHQLDELLEEAARHGPDAHVLFARSGGLDGKNVVLLCGNTPAADFWALATLRQMVFAQGRRRYVREGHVFDFPRFKDRGNKRPRQWEWRYKANYAWFFSGAKFPGGAELKQYHRRAAAWIHHGSPLRATDAEMEQLVAGFQNERGRRAPGARECYEQGCREFVLKFDDTGSELSEATRKRFNSGDPARDYFDALHYFLAGMHRRIRKIDRNVKIYFMPRPYWHNSFEQREFAEALLSRGPLPKDIGLSVCGPEVISWTIPTVCLRDYRELYGLEGKAQIYDNFGRGGEYFAYRGREADLWTEVACVFPERGTPVTRITVYDFLWNPEAYDGDRSLKLAVRELAGRDPKLYRALWNYVDYYNRHRDFSCCPSANDVQDQLPKINRGMKSRFDALVPLLSRSPLAEQTKLNAELWGPDAPRSTYEWGEYARLRRRLEFTPYMLACGYRQGYVAPTADAVVVDGKLGESAWRAASAFPEFVAAAWGVKETPEDLARFRVPAEQSTRMKMLYSPTHLYVGVEFKYRERPTLPDWAAKRWRDHRPGDRANYAWRVPCIELLMDVTGRGEHYFHVAGNIAGLWTSTHCRAYQTEKTGGWWRPDLEFKYALGDKSGTFEAAIPLGDLTDTPPQPGTVWGFQAYRSKIGPFGMFSGVYDLVGGEHGTRQFGRIVFE